MTTFPLAYLGVTINAAGISAPPYSDILSSLQASYRQIYGSDVYLDADSQDGQLLAIFSKAIDDTNQGCIATYNEFSPATAQGAGLSSVVKINGLARLVPSNSSAVVSVVGQVGTVITNGIVGDNLQLGTQWALPATVTIPIAGTIDVTATCTLPGATAAAVGSLTAILTPTHGWQTVTNASSASAGAPVEADATLRSRQAVSTAIPAQSINDAIIGAIANLAGVTRYTLYDNDTGAPDANGIPAHSIAVVVGGGDAIAIAQTIALKKTPGTGTYGTTSETIVDARGVPNVIHFYVLSVVQLDVVVNITALQGFVSTTSAVIKAAVANYLSTLGIGEDSYIFRLASPANLSGDASTASSGLTQAQLDALSATYNITAITQARHGGGQAPSDLVIAFNEAAAGIVANITVTVT